MAELTIASLVLLVPPHQVPELAAKKRHLLSKGEFSVGCGAVMREYLTSAAAWFVTNLILSLQRRYFVITRWFLLELTSLNPKVSICYLKLN